MAFLVAIIIFPTSFPIDTQDLFKVMAMSGTRSCSIHIESAVMP